jgi:Fe-S-cluster containining protein
MNCQNEINPICERCGLCCDGYTFWTDKDYDTFKKELELLAKNESIIFWMPNRSYDNDPKEIKKLIEYHGIKPLRNKDGNLGISVLSKDVQLLKNKKGELGIHIPEKCKYFEWIDNKAFCQIHSTRPIVCREYYCEKIIKKAVEKLIHGVHL